MTERLYYAEPYRTSFSATVLTCEQDEGRTQVVLDRTAFYPTSGGQPFDTGRLGPARVLEVIDRDAGGIAHVVDLALPVGETVAGTIDWPRRFDHMQQHTGQHVLSAAYDRVCGVRTESFHLGSESATIDLAREVSAAETRAAEDEANRIVWEDRAVTIRAASPEEASALPLRKESARTGPLRLIDVEDFDLSACGGTHVARTGAIGIIAVSGSEKFRRGTRIEFLCGRRALDRLRLWHEVWADTARHLSVAPRELAAGVERLQADAKQMQRTVRTFQERLAAHEASTLADRAERTGDRLVVAEALDGWDANGLKAIAAALVAATPAAAVALCSRSAPGIVVVARGRDLALDAAAVLRALIGRFGGKGGGKPDLAQGGGLAVSADALAAAAAELLRR